MRILYILIFLISNLFSLQIINGDTEILKINIVNAGKLTINNKAAKWIANPINKNEMVAIITANYNSKNDIIVKNIVGKKEEKNIFTLVKGEYKKESLAVESSKVKPPKTALERIKKELDEANVVYSKISDEFYFNKPFILPLNSKITSNFGNARIFNNEVKSYHSGIDYRATIGVEIKATNDGIIRIAKDRYYAGKSVVVDHGGGIFSQYYHLSKIYVKVGDRIKQGEVLGLSGDSGRVNGPHLHFGIFATGNSVNPLTFTKKINSAIFGE